MFNFFYDSIETLKQVKKPTKKQVFNLTVAIFIVVILAGIYFAILDGVFLSLYELFYNLMGA